MRISGLHPEGNGVVGCVCGDICLFDALVLFELVPAFYIFRPWARLGPSSIQRPLTPPSTPSLGCSRVRVSALFNR